MPFKKGESGNPNGRPKGAKNKASEDIRLKIEDFITSKMSEVETLWEQLEGKDKSTFLTRLLEFAVPKLRQQDISISEFEQFSDEQLRKIANEVLNHQNK